MKLNPQILFVASYALICGSCGLTQAIFKPTPPVDAATVPTPERPRLVGRVASVPADKKFVLIQSYGNWEGEPGQILTTRGPENRTANLKTTGEKLGEFSAADIQSGSVETGDAVYSQHEPKPITAPAATETLQQQQIPLPENVQKNN